MSSNEKKEYLVQVTITEARHLQPRNDEGLANPFIKIICGDLPAQSTEIKYGTLTPVWNQAFSFTNLMLSENELQKSELCFEVWSKNNFLGNSLVGKYAVGLFTLYRNANHEFYNCWLTLTSDEYPNESQGYLCVNCFIIGPGDKPPVRSMNDQANNDVGEDDEDLNLDNMNLDQLKEYQKKQTGIIVLGKPSIARKCFQLSVYVFKAEHIVEMEKKVLGGGKTDGFISCRAVGLVQKTKTINNNSSSIYNQKMQFPCYFPVLNDKIIMRMWHKMPRSTDLFIGDIPEFPHPNDFFNISKLISIGGRMAAKWVNLYSIPPNERNDGMGIKKKHPRQGTWYMGRVLVSMQLLENEKPKFQTIQCNPFQDPEVIQYRLYFDTYEIKYLKNFDIKIWVDCRIACYSTGESRKLRPNKNNTCQWIKDDESKKNDISLNAINETFPKDLSQVPDIFINLYTGLDSTERIGYIRLKAEEVHKWLPIPRWLHFNPIDMNKDSPGSILVNVQFVQDTENTKRIFKQKGITKNYKLFAHIVSGFEIDPKNSTDDIETRITVDINEKMESTKAIVGRFPFWNEMITMNVELDWKLDFAPDVGITLYQTNKKGFFGKFIEEPIGKFTVPIRSIQDFKKFPHYYNLIRNGEKVGRILALFYICPINQKNIDKLVFPIYENLKTTIKAKLSLFILGCRNLDFKGELQDFELKVDILDTHEEVKDEKEKEKKQKDKVNLMEKINPETGFVNGNITYMKKFEYIINIYGNDEFQIFPYMKITLIKNTFFGRDERFLLFNISEFLSNYNESNNKLYRLIFQMNLDEIKLDQEQYLISGYEEKEDKNKVDDEEEEEEIVLKKDGETPDGDLKKPAPKKEELDEEDIIIENRLRELTDKISKYKNMDIPEELNLICSHKDKEYERETRKKIRLRFKRKLKILKGNIDNQTEEEMKEALSLEEKIKDLSKPLMNEAIFFGFDDLSDEYDYGREVFKEDVFEFHPDFQLPYKKFAMNFIPGLFEEKCEDMGGYFKRGKEVDNYMKLFAKIEFLGEEEKKKIEEALRKKEKEKERERKEKDKKKTREQDENDKEDAVGKELKSMDLFIESYLGFLTNCYFNKKEKNNLKKEDIPVQFDKIKVRVYIYRCLNLTAQDDSSSLLVKFAGMSAFSKANAYIEISLGEGESASTAKQVKYIKDRDNYVESKLSPDFFKCYELDAELPQDWKLTINVMSKNDAGSDSLIGTTIIDLEDRYLAEYRTRELIKLKALEKKYTDELNKKDEDNTQDINEKEIRLVLNNISKRMEELKEKLNPVEFRPLKHPNKKTAQGIIEMLVDLVPQSRNKFIKQIKIEPPPPQRFEIRLVIWETRNVYIDGKSTISPMIKVAFDPEGWLTDPQKKETDVHNGVENGVAKYNWRMKFDLSLPCTFPRLYFTIFDFNVLSSDESIGESYISLRRVLKKLIREGKLAVRDEWIPLTHPKDPGENKGDIKISLYFVTKDEADQKPVGEAWDEPNRDPKLERVTEGRGLLDFLKGTIFDVTKWDFNFNLFGNLFIILGILGVLFIFVVLFISPGLLTK